MQKELLTMLGGLLSGAVSAKGDKGAIESKTVRVGADDYDYQIYVPPQIKTEKNLPVIIFLHGIGQRGSGGFVPVSGAGGALASHYLGQVPAIILLPQCRAGMYWSNAAMDEMVVGALLQTVEEFQADAKRIYLAGVSMGGYGVWHFALHHPKKFAAFVSLCGGSSIKNGDRFSPVAEAVGKTPAWVFHGADAKRIYLTGVSMGGYGVWHFASEHSEKFAALVSICGGSSLRNGDRFSRIAQKVGKTPAWLFHGAGDRVVPVSESRQITKALEANGGNVKYNEYENVGHNVWFNVLAEKDLLPWLFAQQLG